MADISKEDDLTRLQLFTFQISIIKASKHCANIYLDTFVFTSMLLESTSRHNTKQYQKNHLSGFALPLLFTFHRSTEAKNDEIYKTHDITESPTVSRQAPHRSLQ